VRILGVDPGLRVTGYGVIDCAHDPVGLVEAGTISPGPRGPIERRLGELHEQLCHVIAATAPQVMVVEELWTAYKNPTTAVLMGHARGVICLAAHENRVEVRHLGHSHVKRSLTGSGAARKDQVRRMVMLRLRLTTVPEPEDVSDALALALAFADLETARVRLERLGIA